MSNGRQKGGFNPARLEQAPRPTALVPEILNAPIQSRARGFTEVKIVGVGGGGTNAVNRMVEAGVQGVEFIAVNTDAQALQESAAMRKIILGGRSSKGLGAGGDPAQGEKAAEISHDALTEALAGADMVFITAGLGGGTGTGAAPVIAEIARQQRALTVGVVTQPFGFEGARRRRAALEGLEKLRACVDALIVVPNDRLLDLADREMTVLEAFRMADDVLRHGVQGISDLVTLTGLINLDFADVKTIMQNAGTALMAIGEARGENRAVEAARKAVTSPLLDVSIHGARGVLLNISGGPDLSLAEVTEAAETIAEAVDPDANIIFGAVIHPRVQEEVKVTVIATGLRDQERGLSSASTSRRPNRLPDTGGRFEAKPPVSDDPAYPRRRDRFDSPTEHERFPRRDPQPERHPGPDRGHEDPRPPRPNPSDRPNPPGPSTPRPDDDWDIPAFLRRRRR